MVVHVFELLNNLKKHKGDYEEGNNSTREGLEFISFIIEFQSNWMSKYIIASNLFFDTFASHF